MLAKSGWKASQQAALTLGDNNATQIEKRCDLGIGSILICGNALGATGLFQNVVDIVSVGGLNQTDGAVEVQVWPRACELETRRRFRRSHAGWVRRTAVQTQNGAGATVAGAGLTAFAQGTLTVTAVGTARALGGALAGWGETTVGGQENLVKEEAVFTHPYIHRMKSGGVHLQGGDGAVHGAVLPGERAIEAAHAIGGADVDAIEADVDRVAGAAGAAGGGPADQTW